MRCSCSAELESDAAYCGVCGREVRGKRPSMVGLVLDGRFQIDAKIAVGGFATIFRATQVATGADVALKVLHPELTANPAVRARFRRESAALASLRDPHTVATYEAGETSNGTLYIAMELLRGESLLSRFLSRGALPWRLVIETARAVCCSLGEAHARGIVHRDLKPANIHLESHAGCPDFVKVLDFGVAKVATDSGVYDGNELTRAGEAIGTIDYMAPEQLIGAAEVDARSDIFALGVVMYEMVTGRRPFADANGPASLITALLTRTAPPPSAILRGAGAVPPELDGVIMRCLERDANHRFRDVVELRDALDRMLLGNAMTASGRQVRRPLGDLDRTLVDSKPPIGMDSGSAWQQAAPAHRPAPMPMAMPVHRPSPMPMPVPNPLARPAYPAPAYPAHTHQPRSEPTPLPAFDIKVVGTEVGPRPAAKISAARILGWAVVLASAGVAIGAVIASAL